MMSKGEALIITLTKGLSTTVDPIDADLSAFSWYAKSGYAARNEERRPNRSTQFMHRIILERKIGRMLTKGEFCDHVNLNDYDNRRINLRVATHSQNQTNGRKYASGNPYKGVTANGKKWAARIRKDGKRYYLGVFDSPEDAHEAYCAAATEKHGEFARFN